MNKTNLQKMQELRDSDSVVDWESLAFRAFALLTDKQIGKIAKAEDYFTDEKDSDTLVIGMNLSTARQELKDYVNKQLQIR